MGAINLYCASGIKTVGKSVGWIGYLLDTTLANGKPYEKHWFDEIEATRNASGLECVIRGMKHINAPAEICIYTDSNYVKNGIEKMDQWHSEGWANPRTDDKRPNWEKWNELYGLLKGSSYSVRVGIHEYTNWMQSELKKIFLQSA